MRAVVIGERNKEKELFYYLRPEELIPQDHVLSADPQSRRVFLIVSSQVSKSSSDDRKSR